MKIIITGGAGFIGSNVANVLLKKGYKVVVLDNLSSGKKINIDKKAVFYEVDVCDHKAIEKIFKKESPSIVIHNAAQIDVRKSVLSPSFDAKVNILGAINILNACVKNKVKKIIFASSGGSIYGECKKNAPNEEFKAEPLCPYGIAKYSAENYIKFYSAIYGLEYTILRYSNVYGPRQDPYGEAGVVAIFAAKMLNNEGITIFGNGEQMRDYVYVSDVAIANLKALRKGKNQIVNIGTSKAISINDIVKIMSKMINYHKKVSYEPKRCGELFKNFLNVDKAKTVLCWRPKVNIEKGIRQTIHYFKARIKNK
jgi:UDP-glucose 4-epimerase